MKAFLLAAPLLSLAAPVLAAQPTLPSDGSSPANAPAACPAAAPRQAAYSGRDQPRRLGELPQAALMLTVLKSVGGCPVGVVKVGERTYEVPLPAARGPTPADVTPRRR